jgi:type I restriction enzyme S subunit
MKPTSNGWTQHKLNELGFVSRGRSRHRPRNEPSLYGGPYPFFQTGDIKAADLYLSRYSQTYSDKGLAQSKLWKPGTLCITIAANIAETAILKIDGCFPDSIVGFVADPQKADPRFIKYAIDLMKLSMQNISRGTTQDNLSVNKLLTFDFLVPCIGEQRGIADVISAYDDLIENNMRRIKILEEMAQALYREWFVQFRFSSHEKIKPVDSHIGMIPQGWEVIKVEEIVQRVPAGKKYETKTVSPTGAIPVLDQGQSGIIGYHDDEPGVVASEEQPIIVFANHTCYQRLIQFRFSAIQNVLPFVPSPERYRDIYWLHWATKDLVAFNDYKGHWPEFMSKQVLLPPADLCAAFGRIVKPMVQQTFSLERRSKNLRRTRDLLLPKLISGEIEVERGKR